MKVCNKCGTQNIDAAKFCKGCGNKLEASQGAPAQQGAGMQMPQGAQIPQGAQMPQGMRPTNQPMRAPMNMPNNMPMQASMNAQMQAPNQAPMQQPAHAPINAPMQAQEQYTTQFPVQRPMHAPTQPNPMSVDQTQKFNQPNSEPASNLQNLVAESENKLNEPVEETKTFEEVKPVEDVKPEVSAKPEDSAKPNESAKADVKPTNEQQIHQPMPGQPMNGKPAPENPMNGNPMPANPMQGRPAQMPGQPMGRPGQPIQARPANPMQGRPMPGQPMQGHPMPANTMPGRPGQPMQGRPGQPMPGNLMQGHSGQPMQGRPGQMQGRPGQPMPGRPMPGQPMPQPMPGHPMPGQFGFPANQPHQGQEINFFVWVMNVLKNPSRQYNVSTLYAGCVFAVSALLSGIQSYLTAHYGVTALSSLISSGGNFGTSFAQSASFASGMPPISVFIAQLVSSILFTYITFAVAIMGAKMFGDEIPIPILHMQFAHKMIPIVAIQICAVLLSVVTLAVPSIFVQSFASILLLLLPFSFVSHSRYTRKMDRGWMWIIFVFTVVVIFVILYVMTAGIVGSMMS